MSIFVLPEIKSLVSLATAWEKNRFRQEILNIAAGVNMETYFVSVTRHG